MHFKSTVVVLVSEQAQEGLEGVTSACTLKVTVVVLKNRGVLSSYSKG